MANARRPKDKEEAAVAEMERTVEQAKENYKKNGAAEGKYSAPKHEGAVLTGPDFAGHSVTADEVKKLPEHGQALRKSGAKEHKPTEASSYVSKADQNKK